MDLTDAHLGFGELRELDVNIIEVRVSLRALLSEWIGLDVADTVRAIRFRDESFEATNRFLLSLFVPFGDFSLGREQELPW